MRVLRSLLIAILALSAGLYGCATYDSAVPASTGIGAASGALIGYGLTGSGAGAAAGAGAGALAGALTGLAIDESRRAQGPPPVAYGPPPPPPPRATVDPTRGELVNHTGWRIEVYVDDWREPIWVNPRGRVPLDLDIGSHEIVATAYVDTRFGERVVGTYRRTVEIDPRGSGWSLRFEERMFR